MKNLFILIIAFIAGGIFFSAIISNIEIKSSSESQSSGQSGLKINTYKNTPHTQLLVFIEQEEQAKQYDAVKDKLISYLKSEDSENSSGFVFYNLSDGSWFGYRENQTLAPASLFKLPLAAIAYKISETESDFLNTPIVYDNEYLSKRNIHSEDHLKQGVTYTYEQLIDQMLKISDNEPYFLLRDLLLESHPDAFKQFKDHSGIDFFELTTLKSYKNIFIMLYYSNYLSEKNSEILIEKLIGQNLITGIVEPLWSKNITVAHKWGLFKPAGDEATQAFHHCGIIYSENPYVFCTSIRAPNNSDEEEERMVKIAANLSKIVYEYLFEE